MPILQCDRFQLRQIAVKTLLHNPRFEKLLQLACLLAGRHATPASQTTV
ncbi:hypothetical protein [Nostoc sp.]